MWLNAIDDTYSCTARHVALLCFLDGTRYYRWIILTEPEDDMYLSECSTDLREGIFEFEKFGILNFTSSRSPLIEGDDEDLGEGCILDDYQVDMSRR